MKPKSPSCRYKFIYDDRSPNAVQRETINLLELICSGKINRTLYSFVLKLVSMIFTNGFQEHHHYMKKNLSENPSVLHEFVVSSSTIITKYNRSCVQSAQKQKGASSN